MYEWYYDSKTDSLLVLVFPSCPSLPFPSSPLSQVLFVTRNIITSLIDAPMPPMNPLWEFGGEPRERGGGLWEDHGCLRPSEPPSSWPSFKSEHELITLEGEGVQTAVLHQVCDWDNLHDFLTGSSSSSLTSLWICYLWVPDWTAVCRTLGSPDLRLQTVYFANGPSLSALEAFFRSHTDEKLSLRNIGLRVARLGARTIEMIAQVFQGSNCQLEGFSLTVDGVDTKPEADAVALGFANAFREGRCNLRHLSLIMYSPSDETAAMLFQALRSNRCKLSELRLGGLTRVGVKAVTSLSKALQDASCQLQRLLFGCLAYESISILAQALQSENCKLVELRLWMDIIPKTATAIASIAEALRSSRCRLEALDLVNPLAPSDVPLPNPQLLVNALQRNVRLTSLYLKPDLPSTLRVRCNTLLERNRRLRDGELLEQPQAKPHTAKLFICGHEGVGKTTVRKSLRRAKRRFRTINPRDLLVEEPRTRAWSLSSCRLAQEILWCVTWVGRKNITHSITILSQGVTKTSS